MSQRRCLFCGEPFTGEAQAREFLAQTEVDIYRSSVRYERLTGVKLRT
jgi:hypothetical protein